MRELRTAAIAVVVLTLALGLAYPLAMTGISQVLMPNRANGSVIERGGKPVGSRLIGQDFSRDTGRKDKDGNPILAPDLDYFQSRPSVTSYNPAGTFFNNLGPNQKGLAALLKTNLATYLERERPYTSGLRAAEVPPDAVTTSASGVDPQLSEANADIQANRIAQRRHLSRARVLQLIKDNSSRPLFGLAGDRSVNVLELNLALDAETAR
jgi:K+-transporting ATPase ATPase C chain